MRRVAMTIGVFIVGLLPVAAAVSPDPGTSSEIPVAITQPVGDLATRLHAAPAPLSEPGMILLVGSGLIGLASIVRRSTRV